MGDMEKPGKIHATHIAKDYYLYCRKNTKKKKKEHASRKPDKSPEQTVHKEINSSYKEMLD